MQTDKTRSVSDANGMPCADVLL